MVAAEARIRKHHGTAKEMGYAEKKQRMPREGDWLCNHCADKCGQKRWVFADKMQCWTCDRKCPYKPTYYCASHAAKTNKDKKGQEGIKSSEQEVAARAKGEWLELKRLSKDADDQEAAQKMVQLYHDKWQEAERKARSIVDSEEVEEIKRNLAFLEGKPGFEEMRNGFMAKLEKLQGKPRDDQPKIIKDTKRQIEILKGMEQTPESEAYIKALEAKLEQAKRKEGKWQSDELRSAEQKRASLSRAMSKLDDEAEKIRQAKNEMAVREDKHKRAVEDLRSQIDKADEEVEKQRQIQARLCSAHVVPASQAEACRTQAETNATIAEGVKSAFKNAAPAGLPDTFQAMFDSLFTALENTNVLFGDSRTSRTASPCR